LNDADEDDLDVYEGTLGATGSKRVLAYDAADDEDQIAMGSSRKRGSDTVCYLITSSQYIL
jgi:G patch domain-containing protein 1